MIDYIPTCDICGRTLDNDTKALLKNFMSIGRETCPECVEQAVSEGWERVERRK